VSEQFDHEIEDVLGVKGAPETDAVDYEQLRRAEHKAHEIAGAIYGTILATTVVAAIGHDPTLLSQAILVVVGTSAVFYAAHVYSLNVAARMVAARRLTRREVRSIAADEWPMLQSSWPVVAALLLGELGLISEAAAVDLAMVVGIGALFFYGVVLGVREGKGRLNIVLNALIVGAFGVLILLLKIFVH
jgi:hypothetical protein